MLSKHKGVQKNRQIWTRDLCDTGQLVALTPNVWLHSSVGRASHRYRGGHGFESCWSPDIFQASSFQLPKLENLLWWSLFTFVYVIVSRIWARWEKSIGNKTFEKILSSCTTLLFGPSPDQFPFCRMSVICRITTYFYLTCSFAEWVCTLEPQQSKMKSLHKK